MNRLLVLPTVSMAFVLIDLVSRHILKRDRFRREERRAFYIAIALSSLILYISSTGYLPHVYRLGFLPVPLVIAALIGIAVAEWSIPLALWIGAGFVACDLNLLPSRNLIDYFIDPVTAFVAGVWCLVHLSRRQRAKKTPPGQ